MAMIKLPYLQPLEGQQNTIYQFTGLDRRERIPDGAARDMQNLSAEGLPCLSVRGTRGKVKDLLEPALLTFKNGKEILIDQNKLLVDGVEKYTVQTGRKIWAVIGSRVCIFPDKILYNAETDKVEPLSAKQTAQTATFTNSTLTLDADAGFQKGDGVTITGCTGQPYNNRTVVIQEVSGKKITVYDNVFQHGELGSQQPESWQETNITLERVVPDLDFVCEKDNRLWGTHDNAICCCKLGDPKNWNVFNGLSTDAWETQVGSDGAFTGIAAFSSHIIAFKEHICHKVYGTKPTAMQVQVAHIDGVKAGCDRSIVNVNENIFYMAHAGVMVYAGGIPDCISPQLAQDYTEAVGGRLANQYYLSAKRQDGTHELLVFDTTKNVWVREDDTAAIAFASHQGQLYWLTKDALWAHRGQTEKTVPWSLTLGDFERISAERQIVARMSVLVDLPAGSRLLCEMRYDGGAWQPVSRIQNARGGVFRVPFLPRRCERFSVRLSGAGAAVIKSVDIKRYGGSDQIWHST